VGSLVENMDSLRPTGLDGVSPRIATQPQSDTQPRATPLREFDRGECKLVFESRARSKTKSKANVKSSGRGRPLYADRLRTLP
jgi:hypothetical protein